MSVRSAGGRIGGCAVLALVILARADEPSIDEKVGALLPGLSSAEAATRKAALDGLEKLGLPALPALLRAAGPEVGSSGFESCIAAAAAIDADQALAAAETCRSEWQGLGWLAEARKGTTVVDVIEERLLAARKAEWSKPAKLAPATLDDGFRVPPYAASWIDAALPGHLAWSDVPCREKSGKLEIDTAQDGRFATRIDASRAQIVTVGPKERPRRILVHRRGDRWYGCSPNLLRGGAARTAVELLDVEADGDFTGPADLIRFGDTPFRPLREGPFAWIDGALVRFRLRREDGALTISTLPEPEPRWLDGACSAGMAAVHEWRSAFGFAPQRVDAARWRACGLHHEYWRQNGFTAHDEDDARRGWTADGARAGQSSSVSEEADGAAFVRRIGSTVLHRMSLIGRPEDGVGSFSGPRGSLLWGGQIDGAGRGFPALVPAPGQMDVPAECMPEVPSPTRDPGFYQRAHGFPVSVTWTGLATAPTGGRRLELYANGSSKPLAGVTFSAENPYNDDYRNGFPDDSVIFVADEPLPAKATVTARFRATSGDGPVEFAWQFRVR